ncbi:hypothetical protein [uncultured Fibrella sp.]|uniref:hypothetical protein n=1 Tax=uncultured Fibrella sp. TaxID=1284596 RepID=UPI0035C94E5C
MSNIVSTEPKKETLHRLLTSIARNTKEEREDQRYCFILGAGASRSSGIPMASELAADWLATVKLDLGDLRYAEWRMSIGLDEENLAEQYFSIYAKRFELDFLEGYAYLEKKIEVAEPSWGYSVLAQVLSKTKHNVVITTNFDYLIEDALYTYGDKKPLVCGHESLSGFIKPFTTRPIIAKVHRDLLLGPKNTAEETSQLPDGWSTALEGIFRFYTPIVIGYGGNDGSLMNLLEKTSYINRGIFWCYHERSGEPNARIKSLVRDHDGYLVPINGFDEMMMLFNKNLDYPTLEDQINEVALKRSNSYREELSRLQGSSKLKNKEAKDEVNKLVEEAPLKDGLSYRMKAEGENGTENQDRVYIEGIERFPDNSELKLSYAEFLWKEKKDNELSELMFKDVLQINPKNTDAQIRYAEFLWIGKKEYDNANDIYKQVLSEDSSESSYLVSNADFLSEAYANLQEARDLYELAIKLEPLEVYSYIKLAEFLYVKCSDCEAAAHIYSVAFEIDPDEQQLISSYDEFKARCTDQK